MKKINFDDWLWIILICFGVYWIACCLVFEIAMRAL